MPPNQTIATGFVVAIVGYFSSFAIVLQGLLSAGATGEQAASGLMLTAIGMGLSAIILSLWKRDPISVAWTTPGVAFLAVAGQVDDGIAGAVAGFILAGILTVIAGLWRPLGRLAAAIPAPLTQAMLGGILLSICIEPVRALVDAPVVGIPIVLTWFLVGRVNRLFAVPAAVLAAVCIIVLHPGFQIPDDLTWISKPVWIKPVFSVDAMIGVGVPLFVITMATQNIPGIAILKTHNYTPAPGTLFTTVGIASLLTAPFAGPGICLAAITADMCANDDSCPDRAKRYWSAVFAGVFYCVLGLFAGVVTVFASLAPEYTVSTLAGVALISVFVNSTLSSLKSEKYREAAAITFLVTASGISIWSLGAAVSGLLIGGLVLMVTSRWESFRQS